MPTCFTLLIDYISYIPSSVNELESIGLVVGFCFVLCFVFVFCSQSCTGHCLPSQTKTTAEEFMSSYVSMWVHAVMQTCASEGMGEGGGGLFPLEDVKCIPPQWRGGKASASSAPDPEITPIQTVPKIGTSVSAQFEAWKFRVSTSTGWFGVSILWMGEIIQIASLICNLYLTLAAHTNKQIITPRHTFYLAGMLHSQQINVKY